jgi:hypothetical protein
LPRRSGLNRGDGDDPKAEKDLTPMDEPARAAIATASYLVAVVGSLLVFLFAVAHVVGAPRVRRGNVVGVAAAGAWLLVAIGGGYLWFRFLSVV